jgi:hypothetical protein
MRLRRSASVAVAVAALALLGAACQPAPTPQIELRMDIPSGKVDVLSNVITLDVHASCTRTTWAMVRATVPVTTASGTEQVPLVTPSGSNRDQPIYCGSDSTTYTRWVIASPWPKAPQNPLPVTMSGRTVSLTSAVLEPVDYDTAVVWQTVPLTPILCWPGAPSCWMA